MRTVLQAALLASGVLVLAGCTTPNTNAMNANAGQNANVPDPAGPSRDDRRTIPWQFRRPLPQSGLWGGPGFGYGSMY